MGEVFFGRSPGGKAVAVKLIYPMYANDPEFRDRFRREIEACTKVGGFHAVQVVGHDADAPRPWMVTSYVEGPTLHKVLAQHGSLPLPSLRRLGAGLAEALDAIHLAGIIHRDLKPGNILLANDGPRVIDFGIARAVDASGLTKQHGTPGFMAPEVLAKESPTSACDVFALGVVLAHAGGVQPFGDGPADAVNYRVLHEEPDLGALHLGIRTLIADCLEKNPAGRPTPAQILELLEEHPPPGEWLPAPVREMIASTRPREPTLDNATPPQHARLLTEAEQVARALPDLYERASALLHLAVVAGRTDRAQAARLIDDAWTGQFVDYLIESSPAEVGMMLGAGGAELGDEMLAGIRLSRLIARRQPRGIEVAAAATISAIAEAAAVRNPARAHQVARLLADETLRAEAVARVTMLEVQADPVRAEEIAREVSAHLEPPGQPLPSAGEPPRGPMWWWKRPATPPAAPSPAAASLTELAMHYWRARVLVAAALGIATVGPTRLGRPPTDPELVARTVTLAEPPVGTVTTAATVVVDRGRGRDRAAHYLDVAERLARGIAPGTVGTGPANLRAAAVAAIRTAKAELDPDNAATFLAEAEDSARLISTDMERIDALALVALSAAWLEPGRAELIAPSLLPLPHLVGEVALVVAGRDPTGAVRIAETIAHEWTRALVQAALAVRTDPGSAASRLAAAERAADYPARMIEVAVLSAGPDPDGAKRITDALTAGPEIIYATPDGHPDERSATTGSMRSAQYWRSRALADLATVLA